MEAALAFLALTNVAKHSGANRAEVVVRVEDDALRVEVRDDGIGGARPGGSGLVGLHDRLASLGGRLSVESPAAGGTRVEGTLPLDPGQPARARNRRPGRTPSETCL